MLEEGKRLLRKGDVEAAKDVAGGDPKDPTAGSQSLPKEGEGVLGFIIMGGGSSLL